VAICLLFAPWTGAGLLAAAQVDAGLFRFLTASGSALTWLAVAAWVAATTVGAASARELWRARRDRDVVGYGAFTLLCGVVAGQLSSWGVTLLGQDAPTGLVLLHRQQDAALGDLGALAPALFLVVGCYGAVAPWLARRRGGQPSELTRLTVPPLFLSSAFLLLAGWEAVRIVLPGATIEALGRWPELCLPLALATFARLTHQRLRRASTPVMPALGSRWGAAAG
jgi:hypothetical protein